MNAELPEQVNELRRLECCDPRAIMLTVPVNRSKQPVFELPRLPFPTRFSIESWFPPVQSSRLPSFPFPIPGLRLRALPPRLGAPLPSRPFGCAPPAGGLTNAKSTETVLSRSLVSFAPSIAARASASVEYSMSA